MLPSSGIQHRLVCMWNDASEERITFTFRVENQPSKESACSRWLSWFSTLNTEVIRRFTYGLHNAMSQKMATLSRILSVTWTEENHGLLSYVPVPKMWVENETFSIIYFYSYLYKIVFLQGLCGEIFCPYLLVYCLWKFWVFLRGKKNVFMLIRVSYRYHLPRWSIMDGHCEVHIWIIHHKFYFLNS
jgi:hypothetical protein